MMRGCSGQEITGDRSMRHSIEVEKQSRRGRWVRNPGGRWARSVQDHAWRNGVKGGSFSNLPGGWPRNGGWPVNAFWPVGREPEDNLVVLSQRESLSIPNTRKEPPVRRTMTPDRCLTQITGRGEPLRKSYKMSDELCFHIPLIVGCIPLFNGKYPCRQSGWKFPMVAS